MKRNFWDFLNFSNIQTVTTSSKGTISINGKTYTGNSVTVDGNKVIIDGKPVTVDDAVKTINIQVTGDIDILDVTHCDKIEITGNVNSVSSVSGNVRCRDVKGDVETVSGAVRAHTIVGEVNTISGDISR